MCYNLNYILFSTCFAFGISRQPLIKSMRVVKKETLKLIAGWVQKSNDSTMVLENFIPPLLDAVLVDYQRCSVPAAREPEVLATMATTVNKLKATITPQIPKIFDAVFECTLDMINKVRSRMRGIHWPICQLIISSWF